MSDPAERGSTGAESESAGSEGGSASGSVSEDSRDSHHRPRHVEFTPSTSGAEAGATSAPTGGSETREHHRRHRHQAASGKVVCVGVDGSANSDFAVDWYLDEVYKAGDEVVFVHSFELPMLHSYQEMYVSPEIWQGTLKREANRTSEMEKRLLGKLKERQIRGRFVACGGGKAGEGIVKTAESEDADVIVVGTRGQGKMLRALMGSVSSYVMHHAHCPVLVCRPKEPANKKRDAKAGGNQGDGRHSTERLSDNKSSEKTQDKGQHAKLA